MRQFDLLKISSVYKFRPETAMESFRLLRSRCKPDGPVPLESSTSTNWTRRDFQLHWPISLLDRVARTTYVDAVYSYTDRVRGLSVC